MPPDPLPPPEVPPPVDTLPSLMPPPVPLDEPDPSLDEAPPPSLLAAGNAPTPATRKAPSLLHPPSASASAAVPAR